ncbi:MAG: M67 family metallopeptidase [Smithellaceae bacterium]|jgi:[CysO sulfur-carrier protein]-S-L-cysteine hydrolase
MLNDPVAIWPLSLSSVRLKKISPQDCSSSIGIVDCRLDANTHGDGCPTNRKCDMVNLFNLEKKYADDMVAHARTEAPNECCGILAGKDERVIKLYRTTNTEHSPYRYKIDPVQMLAIYEEIQKNKWKLLGVYHSHTHTEAYPSATDIKSIVFPESIYFIVSLSNPDQAIIRGFHITEDNISEVELRIIETQR